MGLFTTYYDMSDKDDAAQRKPTTATKINLAFEQGINNLKIEALEMENEIRNNTIRVANGETDGIRDLALSRLDQKMTSELIAEIEAMKKEFFEDEDLKA